MNVWWFVVFYYDNMYIVMIIRSRNVKILWKLDFVDYKYYFKKLIYIMYIVITNIFGFLKLYIFEVFFYKICGRN